MRFVRKYDGRPEQRTVLRQLVCPGLLNATTPCFTAWRNPSPAVCPTLERSDVDDLAYRSLEHRTTFASRTHRQVDSVITALVLLAESTRHRRRRGVGQTRDAAQVRSPARAAAIRVDGVELIKVCGAVSRPLVQSPISASSPRLT